MSSVDERPALTLGSLILLGLATLTAAVPVVGYVLLGLVILAVLSLVGGFAAMWWQTRWQPLDDRATRLPASSTEADEREVA
jgi:hypothetical protein